MTELFDSIAGGKPITEYGTRLYIYGIYLSNGGTPEAFMDMDADDIDAMYLSYSATEAHRHNRWMEGLIKIIKMIFGVR